VELALLAELAGIAYWMGSRPATEDRFLPQKTVVTVDNEIPP